MSYRDDLDAAHHRGEALERQVALLAKQNRELARGGRRGVPWGELAAPVIGATISGGFAGAALTLGWGWPWAVGGFLMMALSLMATWGAGGPTLETAAVPVERELTVASGGERIAVRLTAVVRVATEGAAADRARVAFTGRTPEQIAAAAAVVLEGLVRERLAGQSGVRAVGDDALSDGRARLERVGLVLDHLWAGPA